MHNKKQYYEQYKKLFSAGITLLCILATLFTTTSRAELNLELTQGVSSATPIAVLPFMGEESIANSGDNIRPIVSKDLKYSGKFKLADVSTLLPTINDKGGVNYEFWRAKKVDDVVTGTVKKDGASYEVSFQLIDVINKTTLLDKQYKVTAQQLRTLAHHISDLIYEKLTGDRGIFSTRIAYILMHRDTANNKASYNLEVADADGTNPKILLTSDQPLMSPAWSPDGKKIAYVSFEGNRANIFVQDVATGQRQVISNQPGINSAPAWSPDGKKLAVVLSATGYPKIYVMNATGGTPEQITSDAALDTEPSWAKDGRSIIFTSNRGGSPQIYRVHVDSKAVERISFSGSYNARASFSADGKNIVLLTQTGGNFNIALQNLESGRVSLLTHSDFNESPSIAPNGKMIVYATKIGGRGVLAAVASDGGVKWLLPARSGEVQEPAWSPFIE
jgi:TolB protein